MVGTSGTTPAPERKGGTTMITDSDNDVAARVWERLDRLEADNAELRSEMSSLRRRRLVSTTSSAGDDRGEERTKGDHDEAVSHRGVLFRPAGAGAAGVGLVAGASVLSAEPAGGTDLGFLQLGHANSVARSSGLFNSGTGAALAVFGGSGVGVRARSWSARDWPACRRPPARRAMASSGLSTRRQDGPWIRPHHWISGMRAVRQQSRHD